MRNNRLQRRGLGSAREAVELGEMWYQKRVCIRVRRNEIWVAIGKWIFFATNI